MKITKILKALLIALSIVMIFSLVACDLFGGNAETSETESENVSESASESESDSENVPGSEQASENESESDSTSESESESTSVSESTSESEEEECKHTNTALNDKCDKVCSDCGVTVATKQHVAGAPDAADKCNVKCTNCGELMEANKHTKGEPDANDNCNVKCTVCGDLLEEGKHQRGDGQPDKNDGCKIKCPVCSTALSVRHGETATVWAPILGVNEDGNLYESLNCVDCGTPRETRIAAKAGWLNTVKVNGVEIAKAQAVGTVLTLEDGKNSSDGVFTAGWVAIVGGVDRYVYRVVDANGNASAWASVVYSAALADANQAIIDSVNGNKLGMTDFTANASFANGMKTGDLSAYIGQTVTIEFGAVPANNKGTDEAPNAIVIGTVKNLNVVCYHGDNENEYVLDANDPQWLVSETCSVCGEPNVKTLASETLKGNYLFNPSYIASKKGTLMTEDGFTFVRITPSLTASEEYFSLYSSDTAITNAAGYIAILYRSSIYGNQFEMFINSTSKTIAGTDNKSSEQLSDSDGWQLVIIDVTAKNSFDKKNVKGLRFDFVNGNPARVEGDYIDIGFVTFFDSTDDACAYYAAYVNAYFGAAGCTHPKNDGVWKAVEGQPGMIALTCTACQSAVNVSACAHTDSEKLTNITPLENDAIFSATADCALCGKSGVKLVSDTTSSGFHVFTPDFLAGTLGSVKSTIKIDENGLSYVQIYPTKASNEENMYLFSNANEPMTNVGKYIAILYRSTVTDFFDFYIDSTTTSISASARTSKMGPTGDTWRLIIQDTSGISNKYDGKKLVALRFDYFNDATGRTAEDHVDVAYIAFFSTVEEAEAYYAAYVAEYLGVEGCSHKFTSDWAKTEEEGIIKNTCAWCEGEIVKACEHSFDDSKWILNEETGLVKNTCLVCEMLLEFACEHKDKLVCVFNGDGTYKYICDVCKQDAGITNESHTVFMPDDLAEKLTTKSHANDASVGANKPFANISALTDPNYNNLPYTRVQVHTATDREAYIYLNFNPTQKNVGKYVAIIYRSNGLKTHEMFISAGTGVAGGQNTTIPWGSSFSTDKWTYAVFDFSAKTNWDSNTGIGTIRWDIDNGTKVGNYLDIAYLGFFNTQAEANAFYAAYSEQYDLDYTFRGHLDFVKIDGTAVSGLPSTTGAGATYEFDLAGKNVTQVNGVELQGWFLSSKGVESYTIYVTDENDEVTQMGHKGADHNQVYGAFGAKDPYNYGEECGKGAVFHLNIDLTGFEGQTVDVKVVANTIDGKQIEFAKVYNITVPAAAAE